MAKLSLQQLNKRYPNGFEAIKSADIEIESGEFTVFVGPSGCGKSTLLRMIAGLESVSAGKIILNDNDISELEPAKRDVAMVFQNYALYPHMSVYKNLAYGLINRKIPKAEIAKRVAAAAELLQLSAYLNHKPANLSGGQRQRVAMGRAIVREPQLFLFDEPLSNLDAKLRQKMRSEIKSLQSRLGTTAIYVTHDQVEAMTMADKIVVLNNGQIEQIDTPQNIYHNPNSIFVATFMGAPPMNILSAKIENNNLVLADGSSCKVELADKQNLKVGIRPEKIKIGQNPNSAKHLHAEFSVAVVEDLGAQRLVYGKLAGSEFTLATELQDLTINSKIQLQIPIKHLRFFDGITHKAL